MDLGTNKASDSLGKNLHVQSYVPVEEYTEPTTESRNSHNSVSSAHNSGIIDVNSVKLDNRISDGARSTSNPRTPLRKELPQDFNHNQFVPAMIKGHHDYEELPGLSRYTPVNYNHTDEQLSGSSAATVGRSDSVDKKRRSNGSVQTFQTDTMTYRKKQNPLYDALSGDDDEYHRLYGQKSRSSSPCQCFAISVLYALVVIIFILVILILLGILMPGVANGTQMAAYGNNTESALQEALVRLSQLESEYASLQKKMKKMNETFGGDIKAVQSVLTSQQANVTEMQRLLTMTSSQLSNYMLTVNSRLTNITKMPGPQGPKGAGDLSRCKYRYKQQGTPLLDPQTMTSSVPDGSDSDWVITGLACSTEGGMEATLTKDSTTHKFKCSCSGKADGASGSRHCFMHIWECPKNS